MNTQREHIAEAHRQRMVGLGVALAGGGYDREVVDRVMRSLAGTEDPPELHEHAIEEAGMCVECDAAMLIVLLDLA